MAARRALIQQLEEYQENDRVLDEFETSVSDLGKAVKKFTPSQRADRSTNKQGRPSLYDPAIDEVVTSLHLLGSRVVDICAILGISEVTYYEWAKKHTSFAKAILAGRELADAQIAASMFHRAKGYSHAEEKIHVSADGDVTRVKTIKHYPPDTSAGQYFLNNRGKGRWRSTVDVTQRNIDGGQVDTSKPPSIRITTTPSLPRKDNP